jgi:hypothetical protein
MGDIFLNSLNYLKEMSPRQMIGNFQDFMFMFMYMLGSWNIGWGYFGILKWKEFLWPNIQTGRAPSGDPTFQSHIYSHRDVYFWTCGPCNFWTGSLKKLPSEIWGLLAERFQKMHDMSIFVMTEYGQFKNFDSVHHNWEKN